MDPLLDHPWWVLALAAFLGVVGSARAVRLITSDTWPPIYALRERWKVWTEQTVPLEGASSVLGQSPPSRLTWRFGWQELFTCPFCFAPYATLISLAWAWASGLDVHAFWGGLWWAGHLWFTLAYLAAMVVVRDEPVD